MKINESKLIQIIKEEMAAIEEKHHDHHVDEEGGMAKSQLYKLAKYAIMLHDALDEDTQLESWVQSKITIASEYMSKVTHYLEYEMNLDLQDPELDMEYDDDSEEHEHGPGCGHDVEPMMAVDGAEVVDIYDIDEEDAYLMEN